LDENNYLLFLSHQTKFIQKWVDLPYGCERTEEDFDDLKEFDKIWKDILFKCKAFSDKNSLKNEVLYSGRIYREQRNRDVFYNGLHASWSTIKGGFSEGSGFKALAKKTPYKKFVIEYKMSETQYGFSLPKWFELMQRYHKTAISELEGHEIDKIKREKEVVFPLNPEIKPDITVSPW
jgi:hypothetical protein